MAGEPPAQKKRRLPFKPPSRTPSSSAGPSTAPKTKAKSKGKGKEKQATATSSSTASASKSAKRTSTSKRQRAESPPSSAEASGDAGSDSGSDDSSHSRERSLSQEPDYILAEIITHNQTQDVASSDPTIPPKLLTKLLHHHFQHDKTKVAKDANAVVAKYVDVFVREAIARAAYEKAETAGAAGARSIDDGFLEVSLTDRVWLIYVLMTGTGRRSREDGASTYDGFLMIASLWDQ